MEDSRFDQLTSELSRRIARRRLALGAGAGLVGLFAAGFPSAIEAAKKSKKKKRKRRKKRKQKKKQQMCTSAFGQKLRCKPDQCCDPATSTIAACTTSGYPTCCASSRLAYPAGAVCCDSYPEGLDGACSSDYPVCCPGSIGGGCCLPGMNCCDPADFGGVLYCCPTGTTCNAVDFECTPNAAQATRQAATPLMPSRGSARTAPEGQAFSEPSS